MHPQNVKRVKFHLNYRHRAIVRDDFFAEEQVLLLTHFHRSLSEDPNRGKAEKLHISPRREIAQRRIAGEKLQPKIDFESPPLAGSLKLRQSHEPIYQFFQPIRLPLHALPRRES